MAKKISAPLKPAVVYLFVYTSGLQTLWRSLTYCKYLWGSKEDSNVTPRITLPPGAPGTLFSLPVKALASWSMWEVLRMRTENKGS